MPVSDVADAGQIGGDLVDGEVGPAAFPAALIAALVTIGLDQFTKELALRGLDSGDPVSVAWKLQFNLIFNTGSAFSLGSGLGPIIGVVALIVAIGALVMSRRVVGRWNGVLIGLVAGGALGNVIDRLFRARVRDEGFMRGAVVDFIDFQFWPVFNVADMAIVGGAIALAVFGLRQ